MKTFSHSKKRKLQLSNLRQSKGQPMNGFVRFCFTQFIKLVSLSVCPSARLSYWIYSGKARAIVAKFRRNMWSVKHAMSCIILCRVLRGLPIYVKGGNSIFFQRKSSCTVIPKIAFNFILKVQNLVTVTNK